MLLGGESLTYLIKQMAINRNYNHNVDVKSSQVGGCLKTFAKLALGAGILTVGGIVVIFAAFVIKQAMKKRKRFPGQSL